MDHDKELEKAEAKLKEAQEHFNKAKLAVRQFNGLPNEFKLAEAIHAIQCHWNHTDGCSWFYEDWDSKTGTRADYVKKAVAVLSEVDFTVAMKVLKNI